ncbi:MAG: hypothetical protein VR64_16190 [Desulfatitalea sp. BRH_c12]|nr:MAG: hypothetical protein VR64_16190 [Desulfatitalea sp. BRH_c12]
MKIKELLAVVDKGWIRKPKGFRVHFEKLTSEGPIVDFVPGLDQALMDSDVVAWRSAWKLFQASQSDDAEFGNGKLVNIFVVDEDGRPVKFYATNRHEIFNPHPPKT